MMRPRFPQRTPVEWAEALGNLVRRGREYVGPCPLCGGTDRFHVAPGRDRDAARVGCRHCIDGHPDDVRRLRYGELARAVFGDSGNPEQLRPPPATSVDRSNRLSVPRLPPTGGPFPPTRTTRSAGGNPESPDTPRRRIPPKEFGECSSD